jgi:proteasome alpha subunit
MTFGTYVPPEQVMKDRSDYARKGIARGKSVVALEYAGGILFLAENPSATLHKVSEIYDRIGFAAVGKYSEFEDLRIAGIRLADSRGYAYGREDVTARTIANAYSQYLSAIFTQQMKPYETELLIAEIGEEGNELYHVLFDGSVSDEHGSVGIGGRSDELTDKLRETYREGSTLGEAIHDAASALASVEDREISPSQFEAAILDRDRKGRRKFRRIEDEELVVLLSG